MIVFQGSCFICVAQAPTRKRSFMAPTEKGGKEKVTEVSQSYSMTHKSERPWKLIPHVPSQHPFQYLLCIQHQQQQQTLNKNNTKAHMSLT